MTTPFKTGRKSRMESLGKWESILEKSLFVKGDSGRLTRIFASTAGLCERQTAGMYFLPVGHERIRKASTEFYFKVGNTFEDIVNVAFSRADLIVDRETRIEAYHEKLPVSGRIDFVIRDPDIPKELVLVELKSCGKLPAKPKPAHQAQLMVYLALTGMPRGIVWYISRSVAGWGGQLIQKAFEVEPSDEEREATIRTVAYGALAAERKLIPPLPSHMKRYKCGFCQLIPYCWDGEPLLVGTRDPSHKEISELMAEADIITSEVMSQQETLRAQFEELMLE